MYYCGKNFKQEAPLKWSLIGGAESDGFILNLDSGEKIDAEALQAKFKIMKQVAALSLRVNLECMGKKFVSLLDSRCVISLIQQSYFDQNIKPNMGPVRGPEAN